MTVTNTVIVASTSGNCSASLADGGHNLEYGVGTVSSTCGFTAPSDQTGDPRLGPLANNGGPTQTFALLPGSPAIAHGDSTVCDATGTGKVNGIDQRGVTRPTTFCAIGAFEPFYAVINPQPATHPAAATLGVPQPIPATHAAGAVVTGATPVPQPMRH